MSPNFPQTGFKSAKIFPGGGQVPWKWATIWSFQNSAVFSRTESGAWTTGVPSSRKVGFEIFLRFLSEDLNLCAYEGTDASEDAPWAEKGCCFGSETGFDKLVFFGERGTTSSAFVGGAPEEGVDFGFMGTAGNFLDHRREISERRDSKESLITLFVAGERKEVWSLLL